MIEDENQNRIDFAIPWSISPLDKWSICGMNHYHVLGVKHLFVSMTKDGICITAEGSNEIKIWTKLYYKAREYL